MYRVMYEIDVDGLDFMGAALEAEQCMKNGDFRPVLVVRDMDTDISVTIDLEEVEVSE